MDGIYQHYIIDLSSNNNFVQIPTVQGDGNNIRGFEVELIQNGIQYPIDKDDCVIAIMGTKPDTKQIVNECQLTDEGYILIDITSQMSAVRGRGDYQIVLLKRSTNSQLKSFPFHILTIPATFDMSYIVSTDEFQLFTSKITATENVVKDANLAISDIRILESAVGQAEDMRNTAEQDRIASENIRKQNEVDRISSEGVRESNEATRILNEDTRKSAETVREDNEKTRKDNETIRISNEDDRKASEILRENSENDRADAESDRIDAENIRIENEKQRVENEANRNDAETDRETAETARADAEDIRIENEIERQTDEADRQANTATAIENAEKATDRANKAAEACEGIASGTGMIAKTEKGAANGVATLDEDCKLTSSQLPIADALTLGGIRIGDNITINNGIISTSKKNVTDALGFTPIQQTDTTTEIVSSTEPENQNVGDFWLQEYE